MSGTLLTLVAILALVTACSSSDGADSATSPSSLPAMNLVDLTTGAEADLAELRGRPVMVNLWAPWCTPCKIEMPALEAASDRYEGRVHLVGVTDDNDREAALEAAQVAGVTYPLLVDTDERLQAELGVTGLPATVFLDADGNVVEVHAGVLDAGSIDESIGRLYGIT